MSVTLPDLIVRWRSDAVLFVRENFLVTPDKWQENFLKAFVSDDPKYQRISLNACAGPGKSAALAWAGLWFLLCKGSPGEHPKGAAVAITWDNLRDNLWSEFSRWMGKSPLLTNLFEWTSERITARAHPETWFLSARSWPKTANEEEQGRTLSGLHSKYVLALIDESGDIPVAVAKAAEQALSNCVWGKIVQAGNPVSMQGMLYAAATRLREQWHVIRVTADPDDPERSPRINIEWARKQIATHGRDDPWVQAYILGKFPSVAFNALLGPDEVEDAMARHLREPDYEWAQKRLGVDCARFGDDATVIFPRQGLVAFKPVEMRNARTQEIAARVAKAKMDWHSELELVDDTGGWGAGVIDSLLQAGYSPVPINFSGKATDPRYFNKRTEMWFEMAAWIKRGGALPKDDRLARELTAATYTFQGGKMRLEEKDQIKERLGHSPDRADALALTFAIADMPRAEILPTVPTRAGKMDAEYDPFGEARG